MSTELACFISPHGYGHATRTMALLQAIRERIPGLCVELFTTVDRALFGDLEIPFEYHQVITDVGLAQHDAFSENRTATVAKLGELLPFDAHLVQSCAALCSSCKLILCDISALGITVGRQLQTPSILIENFTWDWIYQEMATQTAEDDALLRYGQILASCYDLANYRIQTEPLCCRRSADLHCAPIARKQRSTRSETRRVLGCGDRQTILVSMGGIEIALPFIEMLQHYPDYYFIIGARNNRPLSGANLKLIGPDDALHHPDLINGCDLLICKSGYSTIAECLQTDTPICCVSRGTFAESAALEHYVENEMNGSILEQRRFLSGAWLDELPSLLDRKRERHSVNGADQAAEFICSLL
jgi:UDP:flavonoid glycosyltransferase YjiC (YdhE family)